MTKRVLIGGGTGFVGRALTSHLTQKGYNVTIISRTPGAHKITWKQVETEGIPEVDSVVQLSGANILEKRWTEERKRELFESRVDVTRELVKAMQRAKVPPKVFVCGSAVGIYPTSETEEFDETSTKIGQNFAGRLVDAWEKASELPPSLQAVTRRVILRTGVVLGKNGGMLQQMLLPFRIYLGGQLGSGQQFMPWIHLDDLVALHDYAITRDYVSGVLNAVAPQIVTNQEFTSALARAVNRPAFIPVPAFAIKLLFGESAILVLEGQKVSPKRTLECGFEFKYPSIEMALKDAVS